MFIVFLSLWCFQGQSRAVTKSQLMEISPFEREYIASRIFAGKQRLGIILKERSQRVVAMGRRPKNRTHKRGEVEVLRPPFLSSIAIACI